MAKDDVVVTLTPSQARVVNEVLSMVVNDPDWAEMLGSHREFKTLGRARERVRAAMRSRAGGA